MTRLTANDFHPDVLKLFDQFVHGQITQQQFIDAAAAYATGDQTGASLLQALRPKFTEAAQVSPTDARISVSWVEMTAPEGYGRIRGYLVKPANASGRLPGVVVVHENRGLNPHIEDIARRLALDNFIALAPDALTSVGGYPGDEDRARDLFTSLDRKKMQLDLLAAADHFRQRSDLNGKFGAIGFCFGGGVTNFLATRMPALGAAVPFYGGAAPLEDVAGICAPLQLHFAEHDERINAQWPPYEAALKAAGIRYEAHVYAGTQHGFNNDTTPRYDAAAAQLAWGRTLAFLNAHLRG